MPMPTSARRPALRHCSSRSNCSSPSFTPGSLNGFSGCGSERLYAMSM